MQVHPRFGKKRRRIQIIGKFPYRTMARRFPADPKSDLKKAAEDYRDAMRKVLP
jgi:hypothetical protein